LKIFDKKIVIGSWSFSGDLGVAYEKESFKLIKRCIQLGYLEFDIAPTYGGGKIDYIFSKFNNFNLKINTKFGYDKNLKKNFSISVLKESFYKSLNFHNKINCIFLHNPRNEINDWDKIINFMKNLKSQKLVNYIGISIARDFYPPISVLNEFDYVQDEINLLHNSNLLKDSVYIQKRKKFKIMARSPLASGILSKNFSTQIKFGTNDYRYNWLRGKRLANIYSQVQSLKKILGHNTYLYSYVFLFQNPKIEKIICGFRNIKQLNQFLKIKKIKKIKKNKLNAISNLQINNFNFSKKLDIY
jgi:aryl-alcohol dehydrogenase-like predicted oxidoreductase